MRIANLSPPPNHAGSICPGETLTFITGASNAGTSDSTWIEFAPGACALEKKGETGESNGRIP